MKALLSNNHGYETFIEVNEVLKPEGSKHISFYTVWNKAKNPEGKIYKYEMTLDENQLNVLKDFLVNVTK